MPVLVGWLVLKPEEIEQFLRSYLRALQKVFFKESFVETLFGRGIFKSSTIRIIGEIILKKFLKQIQTENTVEKI